MHRTPDPATWPAVARVAEIRIFPLKSGAQQNPSRALLDHGGVVGDRAWALVDADGALLRPRHHRDLARLSLDPLSPGPSSTAAEPRVLLDGSVPVDPAVVLGVAGAALVAVGGGAAVRAALHLVGERAVDDPDAPADADPGRRANLVLTDLPPGAERSWVGARLRAGAALLEVTALPRRCLGVYATVLVPGEVAVGDGVALEPAGLDGRRL